jgi:ATP-dependent exoDNAse (exonuclease V) alpha subunit
MLASGCVWPAMGCSRNYCCHKLESSHILLMGDTGSGNTTTLAVIREGVEWGGYKVEGLAPTSRAAQKLDEAGMETRTLQAHLAQGQRLDTGERRLYIVDESSLASTRQMHAFVGRLHPNDRVPPGRRHAPA